jgi:YkoY family integral membrane protein
MDILTQILGTDLKAASLIILNLILIESLLSVDNAAVLATMVMDLPKDKRDKALKYGIIGAYFFRGICLVFASFLIKVIWLKAVGGLYLIYLTFNYFKSKQTESKEDDTLNKQENKIYKMTLGALGPFWSTVALVEVMDLAFSIDNVFAAVAFTDNLWLIMIGVFIGILAMRFVAQSFVKLIEKFPFLEATAFIVIGILGVKLVMSFICDQFFKVDKAICANCEECGCYPGSKFCSLFSGEAADLGVSLITVGVFVIPILTSLFFNYPKRLKKEDLEAK